MDFGETGRKSELDPSDLEAYWRKFIEARRSDPPTACWPILRDRALWNAAPHFIQDEVIRVLCKGSGERLRFEAWLAPRSAERGPAARAPILRWLSLPQFQPSDGLFILLPAPEPCLLGLQPLSRGLYSAILSPASPPPRGAEQVLEDLCGSCIESDVLPALERWGKAGRWRFTIPGFEHWSQFCETLCGQAEQEPEIIVSSKLTSDLPSGCECQADPSSQTPFLCPRSCRDWLAEELPGNAQPLPWNQLQRVAALRGRTLFAPPQANRGLRLALSIFYVNS